MLEEIRSIFSHVQFLIRQLSYDGTIIIDLVFIKKKILPKKVHAVSSISWLNCCSFLNRTWFLGPASCLQSPINPPSLDSVVVKILTVTVAC